jgi:hypothetical protein
MEHYRLGPRYHYTRVHICEMRGTAGEPEDF